MRKPLPFSLDRASGRTLTDQIVSGVHAGIMRGFWKDGDTLPTRDEITKALGVSANVVQRAVARLAAEGLVAPRPRLGCIVTRTGGRKVRRLVLEVSAGCDCSFWHTRYLHALRGRLARADVQCLSTVLPRRRPGLFDRSLLDLELSRRPDLVVANVGAAEVEPLSRLLDRTGVPYVMTCASPKFPSRHGNLLAVREPVDYAAAMAPFVDDCRAEGVKSVLCVAWSERDRLNPRPALEAAGICVETLPLALDASCEDFDNLFAAVGAAVRRRIGRGAMCDLVFSADDYLTAGLLPAVLEAGLRIPEDVKLVTYRNKGGGPAFTKSLASVMTDPSARGERAAEGVLGWFRTWKMSIGTDAPVYVRGETFPVRGGA